MRWARYVALLTRLLRLRCALGRRQRQARRAIQYLSFLGRELAEASRLNLSFPGPRGHGAQGFNRVPDCLSAVGRKTIELCSDSAEFLLLLRSQVLPSLHSPEHLLLPIWRHGIEALKALFKPLLTLRRKTPKLRIVLQRAPLLVRRETAIAVEPLSRMMSLVWGLIGTIFPLRRRLKLWARLLMLELRTLLHPRWRARL
jgi:hypothetical protein